MALLDIIITVGTPLVFIAGMGLAYVFEEVKDRILEVKE